MLCPIHFVTVSTVLSIPGCGNNVDKTSNILKLSHQFVTSGSVMKVTCNLFTPEEHGQVDVYHISNHSAHNVTTNRGKNIVTAYTGSAVHVRDSGWYCCCTGNCITHTIGAGYVFIGDEPPSDVNLECILEGKNKIHCKWDSDVECVEWRVFYHFQSSNHSGECRPYSSDCEICPHSVCYISSEPKETFLCRECIFQIQDNFNVDEEVTLIFHGKNLWGKTLFQKYINLQQNIVRLDPVSNLHVEISSVDYAIVSWVKPAVPVPFEKIDTLCIVSAFSKDGSQKTVYSNATTQLLTAKIENLSPITHYKTLVRCKLTNSNYWSPDATILLKTESGRPTVGPKIDSNGYTIKNNSVLIYFMETDLAESRGVITGYIVKVISDGLMTSFELSANISTLEVPVKIGTKDIEMQIYSKNSKGLSISPSYIRLNTSKSHLSNKDSISLIVEKDKNNETIWLSVFTYNGHIAAVSNMYWCRGMRDQTGSVICESDFHFVPQNDKLMIDVGSKLDDSWHFAVSLNNQSSGLLWETCIFKCRSCVAENNYFCGPATVEGLLNILIETQDITRKPTNPITSWAADKILILVLKNTFCEQNQWIPYQYSLVYYHVDEPEFVLNETVEITPYLRNISLDNLKPNTIYRMSLAMCSRTQRYGDSVSFKISTYHPKSPKTDIRIIALPLSFFGFLLFYPCGW